jgi:hypothetical protein
VDGTTGWGAIDPVRGKEATRIGNAILKIEVGDKVFTKDGNWIDITKITVHPESTQTYDILSFSGRHSYFANGILAYEENPFFYPIWMNLILDKILERYPNAFPILGYLLGR